MHMNTETHTCAESGIDCEGQDESQNMDQPLMDENAVRDWCWFITEPKSLGGKDIQGFSKNS